MARDHVHAGTSQLAAEVPFSAVSSGLVHPGKSVTTSSSKHRPASNQLLSQTQRNTSVPSNDQQLPPLGKQRLICSVEVPGIGRAAKVNYVKYVAYCGVTYGDFRLAVDHRWIVCCDS